MAGWSNLTKERQTGVTTCLQMWHPGRDPTLLVLLSSWECRTSSNHSEISDKHERSIVLKSTLKQLRGHEQQPLHSWEASITLQLALWIQDSVLYVQPTTDQGVPGRPIQWKRKKNPPIGGSNQFKPLAQGSTVFSKSGELFSSRFNVIKNKNATKMFQITEANLILYWSRKMLWRTLLGQPTNQNIQSRWQKCSINLLSW